MGEYVPNEEQQAVHDDVESGEGNTVVSARAGVGKTATIKSALHLVDTDRESTILVAFSSDIQVALSRGLPPKVECRTLHSLGLGACYKAFGGSFKGVDKERGLRIAREVSGADQSQRGRDYAWSLKEVVSRCKATLSRTPGDVDDVIRLMLPDHPEDPSWVMQCATCDRQEPMVNDAYAPTPGREVLPYPAPCGHAGCKGRMFRVWHDPRPKFIEHVLACLERSTYDMHPADVPGEPEERGFPRSADFDDMCWLPVAMGLKMKKYTRVFVDEAQDLSSGQVQLVMGSLARGGRIFAVGDPFQGIFAFRGAGRGVLERMKQEIHAKELKMTTTYRCGRAIVREAQKLVPDFQAAPGQHEGEVEDWVPPARMAREARAGDFILSRTNAPLMRLCLGFLREGRRANIKGRDIGKKLSALVRRSKAETVERLDAWVAGWAAKESERLLAKGESDAIVQDTRACLQVLMEGMVTVEVVQQQIERMFSDDDDLQRITLSTTHRAKGLERDRVWLLRDTYMRFNQGDEQERNLLYVGITRAIHNLYLVRGAA